jgi:hypothetical protein
MDLAPYVDSLRRELAVAAEAGGADARALAERLTAPLESATRLALLEALSAAADEITRDLAPGSVEVRLRGRDPDFVVTAPPADQPFDDAAERRFETAPAGVPAPPDADEGGTSRITLRIPDHLKPRIDEAASREGLSVNAWLVRVVSAGLHPDDQTRNRRPERADRSRWSPGQHYTGWER